MKKLFTFTFTLFLAQSIFLFSCTKDELLTEIKNEKETKVTKQSPLSTPYITPYIKYSGPRPRYGKMACTTSDRKAGTRCTNNQAGGCRKESSCVVVPDEIINSSFPDVKSIEDWANANINDDYNLQLYLWKLDPITYYHPDSIN